MSSEIITPSAENSRVFSPTAEDFGKIIYAESWLAIANILARYEINEEIYFLKIHIPTEVTDYPHAHEGKTVIGITPDDFGIVLIYELHPEVYNF